MIAAIKDQALQRLHFSRDTFACSAAAYALLTTNAGKELTKYKTVFHETGFEVLLLPESAPIGISQSWSFREPIGPRAAKSMMDTMYAKMISDSVEATREYARSVDERSMLEKQHWFAVAAHLRNAFSHNGKWKFRSDSLLPAVWRKFEINREMEGQLVRDFLPWYQGNQLCAQMINYVSGVVDYRQERIL